MRAFRLGYGGTEGSERVCSAAGLAASFRKSSPSGLVKENRQAWGNVFPVLVRSGAKRCTLDAEDAL